MFISCPCAYVPQYTCGVRRQLSGVAGVGSPSTAWDPGIKLKSLGLVTDPLLCAPSAWPSCTRALYAEDKNLFLPGHGNTGL